MKHTKGEWTHDIKVGTEREMRVYSKTHGRICNMKWHFDNGGAETEANAKLIAAAPDMLDCLIRVNKALEFLADKGLINPAATDDIIKKIKSTVKKATT